MKLYMKNKDTYDGKTGLPNYKTEITTLMKEKLKENYNRVALTLTFNTKVSANIAENIASNFIRYIRRRLFNNDSSFFCITILENGTYIPNQLSYKRLPHIHGVMVKPDTWTMSRFVKWMRRKWQDFTKVNGSAVVKFCESEKKWSWYCTKQLDKHSGESWLVQSTYF
jgi:hypothetical protein